MRRHPQDAAKEIAARSNVEALDFDLLRHETDIVGYPILPLVHQLVKQCGEAGRYVHWGATTQDIMDTAVALQVREGLRIIEDDITALRGILADLSRRHRNTPMAGRTHLQQALPITFGYKTAIWLAMFDRHAERLEQLGRGCSSASSPAPPAPLPHSATRASTCRKPFARSWGLAFQSQPGTSPATALPRRSTSSASSPARSARSRSTS